MRTQCQAQCAQCGERQARESREQGKSFACCRIACIFLYLFSADTLVVRVSSSAQHDGGARATGATGQVVKTKSLLFWMLRRHCCLGGSHVAGDNLFHHAQYGTEQSKQRENPDNKFDSVHAQQFDSASLDHAGKPHHHAQQCTIRF